MLYKIKGNTLLPSLLRFYCFFWVNAVHELSSSGRKSFALTWKRICILAVLLVAIPALMVWNHLGLFLDDILFPNWKDEKVVQPVFIVGNARSGTTFMHRLLTQADNDKLFTTMRTWEILFAVSVTWKILFWLIWKVDGLLFQLLWLDTEQYGSGILANLVRHVERRILGGAMNVNSVHRVGLQEPEEDEWLMMHIGLSQLVLLAFPLGTAQMSEVIFFDHGHDPNPIPESSALLPSSVRSAIMSYYRQCVQRHLYAQNLKLHLSGGDGSISSRKSSRRRSTRSSNYIFISKNPPFTMRLHSLRARFPDAKCICMVRKPENSVPSMVSYIGTLWSLFASPVVAYPQTKDLVDFCVAHYQYPQAAIHSGGNRYDSGNGSAPGSPSRSSANPPVVANDMNDEKEKGKNDVAVWPSKDAYFCRYEEAVKDPLRVIIHLMKCLYAGIDTTHMLLYLQDSKEMQRNYKSKHAYELEEVCQMSRQELNAMFKDCVM